MLTLHWLVPSSGVTLFQGLLPVLVAMPLHSGTELEDWSNRRVMAGYAAACFLLGLYLVFLEHANITELRENLERVAADEIRSFGIDPEDPSALLTESQKERLDARLEEWAEETDDVGGNSVGSPDERTTVFARSASSG